MKVIQRFYTLFGNFINIMNFLTNCKFVFIFNMLFMYLTFHYLFTLTDGIIMYYNIYFLK